MADATVTVRGVNSEVWKKFQTSIVGLHGNLYGNVGEEVTNALKLWLERYRGRKLVAKIRPEDLSISYEDIGGLKEETKTTKEVVEMPLRHPELFRWLNLIPAKAVLVYGPRGTGKNLLAKVSAARAKADLYVLHVQRILTEFNETELQAVFEMAKEMPPSVILIPDLDTVAFDYQDASKEAVDRVTHWLISEIDKLEDFGQVVVVAIASSPEKLPPELVQRFAEKIEVSIPNRQGRYEIFKILAKKMPLDADVDLGKLADLTDGCQGVLLWRICQDAARQALRRTLDKDEVTEDRLSKEKLEQIKVSMDDFLRSFGSINVEAEHKNV